MLAVSRDRWWDEDGARGERRRRGCPKHGHPAVDGFDLTTCFDAPTPAARKVVRPVNATCRTNDPKALPDHQQHRAARFSSRYPLTPGVRYAVAGTAIVENVLHLLVQNDDGDARLAPAAMFETFDGSVPPGWRFSLRDHLRSLEADDPRALAVFGRRLVEASQP